MAAADFYNPPSSVLTNEESLEAQGRDIDQKTLLFQARLRGFLTRNRMSRPHKDDFAVESNRRLSPCSEWRKWRYYDAQISTIGIFNERLYSTTNKTINKNDEQDEHDEHGDRPTQRGNVHVHDMWHTTTEPGRAERTDIQARSHRSMTSAINGSEPAL